MPTTLRIKITAKRQATFPAAALKALRVKPGDYLELIQDKDDWRLAPAGVDFSKLGTLQQKIAPKHPPFDLATWRSAAKDHARRRA
jgi:bifunctional DNA-binding transcriptional regulator/antitoxin component of YhaV-PrlF toxin-antitoxin module